MRYLAGPESAWVTGQSYAIDGGSEIIPVAPPFDTIVRQKFGDEVIDHYVHTANWEQFEYDRRITDWELKRGFERY